MVPRGLNSLEFWIFGPFINNVSAMHGFTDVFMFSGLHKNKIVKISSRFGE